MRRQIIGASQVGGATGVTQQQQQQPSSRTQQKSGGPSAGQAVQPKHLHLFMSTPRDQQIGNSNNGKRNTSSRESLRQQSNCKLTVEASRIQKTLKPMKQVNQSPTANGSQSHRAHSSAMQATDETLMVTNTSANTTGFKAAATVSPGQQNKLTAHQQQIMRRSISQLSYNTAIEHKQNGSQRMRNVPQVHQIGHQVGTHRVGRSDNAGGAHNNTPRVNQLQQFGQGVPVHLTYQSGLQVKGISQRKTPVRQFQNNPILQVQKVQRKIKNHHQIHEAATSSNNSYVRSRQLQNIQHLYNQTPRSVISGIASPSPSSSSINRGCRPITPKGTGNPTRNSQKQKSFYQQTSTTTMGQSQSTHLIVRPSQKSIKPFNTNTAQKPTKQMASQRGNRKTISGAQQMSQIKQSRKSTSQGTVPRTNSPAITIDHQKQQQSRNQFGQRQFSVPVILPKSTIIQIPSQSLGGPQLSQRGSAEMGRHRQFPTTSLNNIAALGQKEAKTNIVFDSEAKIAIARLGSAKRVGTTLKSARNSSRNSLQIAHQANQSQDTTPQTTVIEETQPKKVTVNALRPQVRHRIETTAVCSDQNYFNSQKPIVESESAGTPTHKSKIVKLNPPIVSSHLGQFSSKHQQPKTTSINNVYEQNSEPNSVGQIPFEQSSAQSSHKAVNSSSTGGSKPFLQRILRTQPQRDQPNSFAQSSSGFETTEQKSSKLHKGGSSSNSGLDGKQQAAVKVGHPAKTVEILSSQGTTGQGGNSDVQQRTVGGSRGTASSYLSTIKGKIKTSNRTTQESQHAQSTIRSDEGGSLEEQEIGAYIVGSVENIPIRQGKASRVVKLAAMPDATSSSAAAVRLTEDDGSNYFSIGVKPPQLSNLDIGKIGMSDKIEVLTRNPILSYERAESPGSTNAPFAQKVAELINKRQEPVDDVYGLEQSAALSNVSSAQHTFSLAHHKHHPKLHEKLNVVSMLSSGSPEMLQTIEQKELRAAAVSQRVSGHSSTNNSFSPQKRINGANLSSDFSRTAAAQSSNKALNSKELYMEVVKQLSKDSYGAGQVPISSEVLELLSAQQHHIAEQEQKLKKYEKGILKAFVNSSSQKGDTQEFTIAQIERRQGSQYSQQTLQQTKSEHDNPYFSGQPSIYDNNQQQQKVPTQSNMVTPSPPMEAASSPEQERIVTDQSGLSLDQLEMSSIVLNGGELPGGEMYGQGEHVADNVRVFDDTQCSELAQLISDMNAAENHNDF